MKKKFPIKFSLHKDQLEIKESTDEREGVGKGGEGSLRHSIYSTRAERCTFLAQLSANQLSVALIMMFLILRCISNSASFRV